MIKTFEKMSQINIYNYNGAPEPKTRAGLKNLEMRIAQYPPLLQFIDAIDPEHEDTAMINGLLSIYEDHLKRISVSKVESKPERKTNKKVFITEVELFGEKELTKSGQEKAEKRANGGKAAIDWMTDLKKEGKRLLLKSFDGKAHNGDTVDVLDMEIIKMPKSTINAYLKSVIP